MEYPNKKSPKPIEVNINDDGYSLGQELSQDQKIAAAILISSRSAVSGNWASDGTV